jgi:hypothetical protein
MTSTSRYKVHEVIFVLFCCHLNMEFIDNEAFEDDDEVLDSLPTEELVPLPENTTWERMQNAPILGPLLQQYDQMMAQPDFISELDRELELLEQERHEAREAIEQALPTRLPDDGDAAPKTRPVGRVIDIEAELGLSPRKRKRIEEPEEEEVEIQPMFNAREYVYKPPMNLAEYNEKIKEHIEKNEESLEKVLAKYIDERYKEFAEKTDWSYQTFLELDDDITNIMNSFCALVTLHGKDTLVVVRYLEKKGNYAIATKTLTSFREMLKNFNVATIDPDRLLELSLYKRDRKDKRLKVELNPALKRRGKTVHKLIEIKVTNVVDIWIRNENCRKVDTISMNPRPSHFKYASGPNELNVWSGYALKRDDVKDYTEWGRLTLLFNHLRYSWCDNDNQFCYLLGQLALLIQCPWVKSGVSICVVGPEGHGKSFMGAQVLPKIIGLNHSGEVHSSEVGHIA